MGAIFQKFICEILTISAQKICFFIWYLVLYRFSNCALRKKRRWKYSNPPKKKCNLNRFFIKRCRLIFIKIDGLNVGFGDIQVC